MKEIKRTETETKSVRIFLSVLLTTRQLSGFMKVSPQLRETVLAEDVFAPGDVPSSKTTNMDGYALRCRIVFALV